ncbi:MAG: FadR/GntR family transcriptional regulator [Armatimonadota bacterium]|nr:FadR/GntR family transcriptional regulator [Armatimonadota bacterium]MDR5703683.1 FadR/GntR family transcriptional regulator [Armatimonadota bacterium]MDR7435312.1 FadR/GntR family transcriptional regulator [Armatimonadota bacterium]
MEKGVLGPVRKTKVYEEVASRIQRLILEGRLKPGDYLPPERELAEVFGVSRTSIRDAIRVLELLGLVEPRHGEGTLIKEVSPDILTAPLTTILTAKKALLAELLEVRKMFEPNVARYAALRASPEEIEKLQSIVARQEEKVQRGEVAIEEDDEFHYTIAKASRNQVTLRVVDVLMDLLRESRERALQIEGRPARSLQGHKRILQAIQRRDGEAAAEAMFKHIEEIEEILLGTPVLQEVESR